VHRAVANSNLPHQDTTVPDDVPGRVREPLALVVFGCGAPQERALPLRASLSVGRDEKSDVRVDHPSVSRIHAVLDVEGERLTIRDLGSVNGVRVRGRKIATGEAAEIGVGEVAEVGRASLAVVVRGALVPSVHVDAASFATGAVVAHPSMVRLYELVARTAASDINALVLGETGVGKELLAEALHRGSARAAKPLVRVNCAALSPTLVESELFGHEKGAFTGATVARPGLLETADGGTLFLDEVGELPLPLQVKLLRVLEDRQVLRVGAQRARTVDLRFVAATHRDLRAEIERGNFRRDLYYRLNGISLVIPPLRARVEEVRPLAEHFLAVADPKRRPAPLAPEVIAALEAHDWPGNVRELRNVMARAALVAGDRPIAANDLPEEVLAHHAVAPEPGEAGLRGELGSLERRRIEDALAQTQGNQTRAAVLLGMPRRTLVARLKEYGIERPIDRRGR
jgi:DNA-binding NtrC family response regulator